MINKIIQSKILLFFILLGAFSVRLYHFNSSVLDWHSWRQADTSSVSRNFIKDGFDILHPRFDDLSNGVSLLDNPHGYRFVEFPIYNVLQAGFFRLFDFFTIEEWGRLVTIASSLGAITFLYLLARRYISARASFFAAFFYAFVPYSIYYGRTILPDQLMMMAMLAGIYFFDRWIDKKIFQASFSSWRINFQFLLAVLFTAIAILIKPYVLFFSLPLIYIAWKKFGLNFLRRKDLWLFLFLSLAPFLLWRFWMQQYPEGIPRNDWLFNGNHIRFKGAFFQWIFAERIAKLILGYWGLPLVILGVLRKNTQKEGWFFFTFIVSSLLYMLVLATGNVQHDYYQMLIIPTLAVFFGKGVDFLFSSTSEIYNRRIGFLLAIVSMVFMFMFGWYNIRDYYNINHPEIIEAGSAIDRLTPKNAKVIAVYGGDTTFLYYANRQGWPVFERSLKEFKKAGAGYIAFVNPTLEELNFGNYFVTLEKTKNYAIFDLTKPLAPIQ